MGCAGTVTNPGQAWTRDHSWAPSSLQHTDPGRATSSLRLAENLAGAESPRAPERQSWSLWHPRPPPLCRDKPEAAWNSPILGQEVQRFPRPKRSQHTHGMWENHCKHSWSLFLPLLSFSLFLHNLFNRSGNSGWNYFQRPVSLYNQDWLCHPSLWQRVGGNS